MPSPAMGYNLGVSAEGLLKGGGSRQIAQGFFVSVLNETLPEKDKIGASLSVFRGRTCGLAMAKSPRVR